MFVSVNMLDVLNAQLLAHLRRSLIVAN
jgi:hypothetical protein